jgi:hypothetical protein
VSDLSFYCGQIYSSFSLPRHWCCPGIGCPKLFFHSAFQRVPEHSFSNAFSSLCPPSEDSWRCTAVALIAVLTIGCSQQFVTTKGPDPDVPSIAKFEDATAASGLNFKQSSGGCGNHYFVEQVAAGAAFLDANNDGHLDIYFPQPKPLGTCKFKEPLRQRLYMNDGKGHFTLAPNAFGNKDTITGSGPQ